MPDISSSTTADLQQQIDAVKPRPRTDKQIWGLYFCLVTVSLVELYSASSREITSGNILGPLLRHGMMLLIGFVIMLLLQRTHYRKFYNLTYPIVGLCLLSVVYTMFFGLYINGARRAFSFFGLFTVQPSELVKFGAALLIARMLSNYIIHYRPGHEAEDRHYNKVLVSWVTFIVVIACALLVKQGMTNTILLLGISCSMFIIGGVRWKTLGRVLLVFLAIGACYGVYKYCGIEDKLFPKVEQADGTAAADLNVDRDNLRMKRIEYYLRSDKYNDTITSENSQEMYSYIAQANGGPFGRMPGNSRETARLPLAFSDYIYAIVIEDLGFFLGGVGLMAVYLLLLARAGRIAMKCKKSFPALLVIGMAMFIMCQALMHMGIVTGFLPVSGQPLPLISKGGSSVIVTSIALGMMLSVSRFALRKGQRQEANDRITALSDKDMPDNPTQI